ncbi:patatin-like phospholipase family protein [Streptomyces cyaneochromogenes]|uniref:patatin-like phospholipase family protein n=1 Tax=Streptomyces cyaneochromogenes TaxID=2496836 RepID=UPI00158AB4EE|nr:patatin-like phospholipase family protein [Streptomyces cyaneochromogenes]
MTGAKGTRPVPSAGDPSAGLRALPRPVAVVPALPDRIEELAVPFTVVAMDLVTGAPAPLDHGDLESALLAGAAIPGMLPPVDRDVRTLVDGDVVAHVPVLADLRAGTASSPWDFGRPQRLIGTASRTAGRFVDGLRIDGPGLYRADGPSTPSAVTGGTATSSVAEAGL